MDVRDLTAADAGWAAAVMAARREVYASYSPVFWRPRRGITDRHARFLGRQVQDKGSIALRTDHGFLIAQRRDGEGFVDDFAVDGEGTWADDGLALLSTAWDRLSAQGIRDLRVVTAQADEPKVAMLVATGLRLVEQWWVKPVEPRDGPGAPAGRVDGPGFSGLLGPAPPVYDPGGPVLLTDRVAVDADLTVIEDEAARMGSVLVVIPTKPGSDRERACQHGGWNVASSWYLGERR